MDMIYDLLDAAEDVYGKVTPGMRLEVERARKALATGQRPSKRYGVGMDIIGPAEYVKGIHERKHINARLSMKKEKDIVIERELEAAHRYGLYVDVSGSMDYQSAAAPFTKKQSALIKALVLAADLGVQEESVAVVSDGRFHKAGHRTMQRIAGALTEVMIAGEKDIPEIHKGFRPGDSVVWFSDFMPGGDNDAALLTFMDEIDARGMHGYFVMVLDPEELSFNFKGNTEFRGKEGERSLSGAASAVFDKAESIRAAYLAALRKRIETIRGYCAARDFAFVLQPTHKPLEDAIHHLKDGQENPLQHIPEVQP